MSQSSAPHPNFSGAVSDELSVFDRLPDDVLLLIFNKLRDAKSLSLCSILCTRFRSLIPQTNSLLLSVPTCPAFDFRSTGHNMSKRSHPLVAFASKLLIRPFRSLLRVLRSKSAFSSTTGCTCRDAGYYSYSPAHYLRNFRDIRMLELALPSKTACIGEFCGLDAGSVLKWTAEFDSQLKSCVIVGGTSISHIRKKSAQTDTVEDGSREELQIFDNEELKLRIVWTVSCLISASARHSFLRETMNEHRAVASVTVTDDIGQGRFTMNSEQIEDMRVNFCAKKTNEEAGNWVYDRTRVPALKMKMWITPELVLPEKGCVMEGATLVVVQPAEGWNTAEEEESTGVVDLVRKMDQALGHEEERVFVEAAKKLMKLKRSYTLEMNSF
ncbi:unnamed protein product [Cuscuta epithymum]|uniref:F-box domain-containing protein n=1 Tax=Cuscuta epithymum TaxID=186058 RepID=A0AAV0FG04_9ASTE|nr:unnamed protein product [Cuscuta epithymum]